MSSRKNRKEPHRRPIPQPKVTGPTFTPRQDAFERRAISTLRPVDDMPDPMANQYEHNGNVMRASNLSELIRDTLDRYTALRDFVDEMGDEAPVQAVSVLHHAQAELGTAVWAWEVARNSSGEKPSELFADVRYELGVDPPFTTSIHPSASLVTFWVSLTVARQTLETPAFLLPSGIGGKVMNAEPIAATEIPQIELPHFRNTVWFSEPFVVPPLRDYDSIAQNLRDAHEFSRSVGISAALGGGAKQEELPHHIDGVTFTRLPDGTLSPHVWIHGGQPQPDPNVETDAPRARRELPPTFVDLREPSIIGPALLNLASALDKGEFWYANAAVSTGSQSSSTPTESGQLLPARPRPRPSVKFYSLGPSRFGTRGSKRQGREMPEYGRKAHLTRRRIGPRSSSNVVHILVDIEEKQVNEGKGRPVVSDVKFHEMPVTRNGTGFFEGFKAGDLVTETSSGELAHYEGPDPRAFRTSGRPPSSETFGI